MRKVLDESRSIRTGNVSVTIRAEPLEVELDPRELAIGPARAMRDAVQAGLRGVGAAAPKLAHGADWLASEVGLREVGRGVFEISVPSGSKSPSGPLLRAVTPFVPAIGQPFTPANVKRALELAESTMARVRRR